MIDVMVRDAWRGLTTVMWNKDSLQLVDLVASKKPNVHYSRVMILVVTVCFDTNSCGVADERGHFNSEDQSS